MRIYFDTTFAGTLSQIGNGYVSFTYDVTYLRSACPPLSLTLPKQIEPYITQGLPAYFDNLVAEGWLKHLQARQLGVPEEDRFTLLSHYGHDLIGCTVIESDKTAHELALSEFSIDEQLALASRFSLSGVQPKLLVVKEGDHFRLKSPFENSTHIAKLQSPQFPDLVENEYITTLVFNQFVDKKYQANLELSAIEGIGDMCLCLQRFDRINGSKRHFEEANQCLNKRSSDKYDGTYDMIGTLQLGDPIFIAAERLELFKRICLFILLGNTDAHFKNFGFFSEEGQYWLTPGYDVVSTALYPQFQTFAMPLTKGMNAKLIKDIQVSQLIQMGKCMGLEKELIYHTFLGIDKKFSKAVSFLEQLTINAPIQKNLNTFMEKRWNHLFKKIGNHL